MAAKDSNRFWRRKALTEMSAQEWESLCDGCGHCCRVKLQDVDHGEVVTTSFACTLLDLDSCQCSDYTHRARRVPGCLQLTPEKVLQLPWLPDSCAYVKVARGEDLEWWHHLISGSRETVHEAGRSVRGKVRSEAEMEEMQHVIEDLYGVDFGDDAGEV